MADSFTLREIVSEFCLFGDRVEALEAINKLIRTAAAQAHAEGRAEALRCGDCGGPLETTCASEACIQRAMSFHTGECISLWPATDPACPCAGQPSGDAK